jgi:hypothetical protein
MMSRKAMRQLQWRDSPANVRELRNGSRHRVWRPDAERPAAVRSGAGRSEQPFVSGMAGCATLPSAESKPICGGRPHASLDKEEGTMADPNPVSKEADVPPDPKKDEPEDAQLEQVTGGFAPCPEPPRVAAREMPWDLPVRPITRG